MLSPYDYVQIVDDDNWGLIGIVPKGSNSQINSANLPAGNTGGKINKILNIPNSGNEFEINRFPSKITDGIINTAIHSNLTVNKNKLLEPIKSNKPHWEEQSFSKESKYIAKPIVKAFPVQITLAEISHELLNIQDTSEEKFGNISSRTAAKRGDVLVGLGK